MIRMVKRAIFILLIIMIAAVPYGCSFKTDGTDRTDSKGGVADNVNGAASASDGASFRIVTSFYPVYITALNVARGIDNVQVINMTQAQTGCLHDYQLRPEDLKLLESADVFLVNGVGMESFLEKVIEQQTNLPVIEISSGIPILMHDDEENAHVWVSVSNAMLQVKNTAESLSGLDPENADLYSANADAYIRKLQQLKETMHEKLDDVKNRDIITFHEAFPYFAEEFGLNIAAVIEREPGTVPTAQELGETIDIIQKHQINALFVEPQYSSKAADTIASETGAKVYVLDPVVTGEAHADAYDDYIRTMEQNLAVLTEALK